MMFTPRSFSEVGRSRIIFPLLFLALAFSAAGAAPAAHAQATCHTDSDCNDTTVGNQTVDFVCVIPSGASVGTCAEAAGSQGDTCLDDDGCIDTLSCSIPSGKTIGTCEAPATPSPASTATPAASTPTLYNNGQTTVSGSDTSYGGIMTNIMGLFAWLLGVAALTLDNVMYYTVVQMGTYVHQLTAIGTAWRVLRDIGNIILIFGFLAIGVCTILDVDWYGGGTKMLPLLLVAAVFLNFSLFISEAVIDGGNLFATEFYTQINNGQQAAPQRYGTVSIHNEGISNAIMSQLGLASIYGDALVNTQVFNPKSPWYIGFMGIILFLIAAFVMFSLAFILIARFIILIILIVIAPIGFAGLAVPQLKGTASQWWNRLFQQTITAPVLLLLLYVALAVITDAHFLTGFGVAGTNAGASDAGTGIWTGFLSGNLTGFGSMMLAYFVAMGLLLLVTIVAKQISAFGADWATGLGGKLTFGATAFVGRRTVGRASSGLSRTIRSSRLGRTEFGRGLAGVVDYGAKGTYDLRGAGALGKQLQSAGAGEADKTTYGDIEKKAIEAKVKYGESLQNTGGEARAKAEYNKTIAGYANERDQAIINKTLTERQANEEFNRKKKALEAQQQEIKGVLGIGSSNTRLGRLLGAKTMKIGDIENAPQEGYIKNLESGSGLVSAAKNVLVERGSEESFKKLGGKVVGLGADAGSQGAKIGTGAGLAAGLGAVQPAFLAGTAAYLASAGPRSSGQAASKLKKGLKQTDIQRLQKTLSDAGAKT